MIATVQAAQRAWAAEPLDVRCSYLRQVGRRFAARAEEVARVVCEETGKLPLDAWWADVVPNLDLFTWWTGAGARPLRPRRLPLSGVRYPGKQADLLLEPKGVIGLITPWNYPIAIPLRTLVPALLAGNAVMLKPSEVTPRCGALLGQLFGEVLPGGVVTVVQGGADAGRRVVDEADHVVFVGSVAAGREVATRCAEQLKTVGLELGGNDAALVLRDADLERTVAGVLWGACTNSGQNCAAVERVYVERPVYAAFLERLLARAAELAGTLAPAATPAQAAIVQAHLDDAVARGARAHGAYPPGPVVLTDVPAAARVLREETFGPLCPVVPVESAEEGLRLANDTRYGLTLSIWTDDEPRARSLAGRARAGVITINNVAFTASMPFAPWSGRGDSGHGVTGSELALRELVQPRLVVLDELRAPEPWWFPATTGAVDLARRSLAWLGASPLARVGATPGLLAAMRARRREQVRARSAER